MKCFVCYRLFEEDKIMYTTIRAAQFVYSGDSVCEVHLDLVRRHGLGAVLEKGMWT